MKIVIWGHHPLHTSTHGYIHSTYAKAFQYLGNEVNWVPNSPNVDLDFSNSIFFSKFIMTRFTIFPNKISKSGININSIFNDRKPMQHI